MKVLGTAFSILLLAMAAKAQAPATIVGDYVEVRSGHVYTCGCLYSGESVTGGKEAILVWRIASGSYQGTPLSGIKVAAVVVGESNLGGDGTPRQAVLFVDGTSSSAQKDAVLALWRREYSGILGQITSVRDVPIGLEQQGETVTATILGVAYLRVRKAHLPEDAHLGSSLWYAPFAALRDSTLATALLYEYSGGDFQRQWRDLMPSISGYMGSFSFASGT